MAESNSEIINEKNITQNNYYRVNAVAVNDTLSLRLAPNSKAKLVLQIPHNATGLLKLKDSGKWTKISYSGNTGWVHGHYLKISKPSTVKNIYAKELFCFGGEPHWILNTNGYKIIFNKLGSKTIYWLNSAVNNSANNTGIKSFIAINPLRIDKSLRVLTIRNKRCSDGMRDKTFPYSAVIFHNNIEIASGCCQ